MGRTPWATYFWPGLPQLWVGGLWSGLILAVGFAVLLNLVLLGTCVWVELLTPLHVRVGWVAVVAFWGVSSALSIVSSRPKPASEVSSAEGLLRQALSEYLQGNGFEAEIVLCRLLELDPRDIEARLLLATLCRHAGRYDEALEQLTRLERLRGAEKWVQEIAFERREIANGQQLATEADPPDIVTLPPPAQSRQAA
jgi:hypothetical protein